MELSWWWAVGLALCTCSGNYCSVCIIMALRYLPLGVLPSWSRSVCNITFVFLEFALSSQTLGNSMEQVPHKFFLGKVQLSVFSRTSTAYTLRTSLASQMLDGVNALIPPPPHHRLRGDHWV